MDAGDSRPGEHQVQDAGAMNEDVPSPDQQNDKNETEKLTASWKSLFDFTNRRHSTVLITALILSMASGIVIPTLAIFLGKIFGLFSSFGEGKLTGEQLRHEITIDCFGLIGLGSASWALNGGYFMAWLVFGELQGKSVRDQLYGSMLEKDLEWFEMRKDGIGALLPRLQTYVVRHW